jgi:hypothetical protein
MVISQLTQTKGPDTRWITGLADTTGNATYELAIRGPKDMVMRVFERSDFEFEIDPNAFGEAAQRRLKQLFDKYSVNAKDPFVDPGQNAFKKPASAIDERKSIVVSVRRTEGRGTFWALFFPLLALPRGFNLFFILPPVSFCQAWVLPVLGDADLFLTLNGPMPPIVASSTLAGTAIDTVSFGLTGVFVPFFRVTGFTTAVTGFLMAGF